jgi:hypothetical protein
MKFMYVILKKLIRHLTENTALVYYKYQQCMFSDYPSGVIKSPLFLYVKPSYWAVNSRRLGTTITILKRRESVTK